MSGVQSRALFEVTGNRSLAEAVPRPGAAARSCAACPIRHLTVCDALAPEELHELAAIVSNVELTASQPLFDEGEPAIDVFVVTSGTLRVYRLLPDGRRQVTGFLFSGDYLGLVNSESYAFSADAVTPALLCRFPRKRLEGLIARFPKIETKLLGIARHELAAAQDQMLLLGRKTARERIASFLLMLSDGAVRRGQPSTPVAVPMSRGDIGDFLGLTTETVSRCISQLKKTGLVTLLPNGRVELADRKALEELAEGFTT